MGDLVGRCLVVEAAGGRRLLDEVDVVIRPGELTAIVGPSGSGKSTLLAALAGVRPASSGTVEYDGADLYATFASLRHRIGHVPQDEVLHRQITVRQALSYAAELRFGSTYDDETRRRRIDEVIAELGLSERGDLPIERLSGGQQQRVSVGLELLTRPSVLFLDEPTAGLDPAYERSLTRLFRDLADGGRTVVVVTHAVASLDLCDTVIFLAPGGKVAFVGPPGSALAWFGASDYPDVFLELEENGDVWAERYAAAIPDDPAPEAPRTDGDGTVAAAGGATGDAGTIRSAGFGSQVSTLSRRTARVLRATRGQFRLLLAQAPVIALLLLVAVGFGNLSGSDGRPRMVLAVLMLGAVTMGLVNSCREIVRELPMFKREHTSGLSIGAYLLSKFVVLGAIALMQSTVLVVIVVLAQDGPNDSILLRPPILELGLVVFLTALAAVALGLAISAWVPSDAAALVLIPVTLIGQLVLSDSVIPIADKPVLAQAAWTAPSYWGFRAEAVSAHLTDFEMVCVLRDRVDELAGPREQQLFDTLFGQAPCRSEWRAKRSNLALSIGALGALTIVYAAVAYVGLVRKTTRRRRTRRGQPVAATGAGSAP